MLKGLPVGYISVGIFAVSGLLINVIIANSYGAAGLGTFAQTLAIYLVFGQLVTGSLHISIVKDSAINVGNIESINKIIATVLTIVTTITIPIALLLFFLAQPISIILDSNSIYQNIQIVSISLFPFALNKILLGILNGLNKVRTYHSCQIIKHLSLAASTIIICGSDSEIENIAITFLISELITLLAILINYRNILIKDHFLIDSAWAKRFFSYLKDGYTASLYPELNLRVDLLIIGLFLSDTSVGIYSISQAIYEGVSTLLSIYRVNVNSIFARLVNNNLEEVRNIISKTARQVYPLMFAMLTISLLFYENIITIIFSDTRIVGSFCATHILLLSTLIVCGLVPFNHFLLHIGEIKLYRTLQRNIFLLNTTLNIILINTNGIEGAAMATGLSLIVGEVYWYRKFRKKNKQFDPSP
ncbi:hypothetical protein R50073_26820 [Maricurvus nonylphenolicus]|uniref:oligosaccharide flippase family protein n=1 Tax=Maricurvus nonylphenolicus TaxID=1008307 RepID=UPI0036F32D26